MSDLEKESKKRKVRRKATKIILIIADGLFIFCVLYLNFADGLEEKMEYIWSHDGIRGILIIGFCIIFIMVINAIAETEQHKKDEERKNHSS